MLAPLNHLVEYDGKITRMRKGLDDDLGPYSGKPDDGLDRLWTDLYEGISKTPIPSTPPSRAMPEKKKRIEENKLTIVSATEVETIHIPQSEARNLYDSTVPIWNMTGEYMIGVEVFHQLHCLVSFLYKISESSPHIISNGWFRTLS